MNIASILVRGGSKSIPLKNEIINSNYRPDIEGLRAVAVISVVLFHAGYSAFPAGFIGVDIFFVISGFLITSGIYKGIQQDNFSIISFFNRRFWRIQPLLLALMIVTVLFEYWRATPEDLIKFASSLKSLSLFTSNQYFASLDFGYFADDTSIMPLLHTWSLSIEWQWYFLLPFLLVLLANDFGKKVLPWILLVGFAIMAYLGVKDSNQDDNIRYYSFAMRCFALLAGAFIATIDTKSLTKRLPIHMHNVLSFVFLGLLIYIGTIEKTIPQYPNFFCLWVVLLTAFLIILGSSERKTVAFRILSFKPFVFLGMISYSLYIWHWSIFAFARYTQIQVTSIEFAVLILLSIVVATLSYKFIENPLRKLYKKIPLVATLIILVLVPAVFAHHFDRKVAKYKGYPERNPNYAMIGYQPYKYGICHDPDEITENTFSICKLGDLEQETSVLLMGDSFTEHSRDMIGFMLSDAGMAGVSLTYSALLPFVDIDQASSTDLVKKQNFSDIASQKYDYVVIGNSLSSYYTGSYGRYKNNNFAGTAKELFVYAIGNTVDFIVENGATPVFITGLYDRRNISYSPQGPISDYSRCGIMLFGEQCSFEDNMITDKNELEIKAILQSIKEKYPQTIIIDIHDLLCQEGKCSALIDGRPVYMERNGHITHYASRRLGEMYLEKYGNPFVQ